MKVFANGFPKHGNHALVKALQLLGVVCDVNHEPYSPAARRGLPAVFVKRDPRTALVSWLRFEAKPVTQGMFLSKMRFLATAPLFDELAAYEGWLTDANTIVVRYEDLIASDAALRELAQRLGVPFLEDAFENLPGATRTWNVTPSSYAPIWTPTVQAAWSEAGGDEVLRRWGY